MNHDEREAADYKITSEEEGEAHIRRLGENWITDAYINVEMGVGRGEVRCQCDCDDAWCCPRWPDPQFD